MTQTATAQKPRERMQESFPDSYEKGNGWNAHDDNPRFDWRETEEGNIILNPWTGHTKENVLAMGNPPLKMSDLFAKSGTHSSTPYVRRAKLDLLELAWYMRLDWRYLAQLGYEDGYIYINKHGQKTTCVRLGGYCSPDGTPHSKNRVRISLTDNPRFLWDQGTPGDPLPCGLHRLHEARKKGYLFIGEGESDAATMWFHKQPFLGIPGASVWKHLDVSLLKDIPRIFLIEEPDQARKNQDTGKGFYADGRAYLRAGGYTGEIFSIRWQAATGYKDPSAMHKYLFDDNLDMLPSRFQSAIQHAIEQAIPEGNETLEHQEDAPEPNVLLQSAFPSLSEGPEGMRDLLRWIMGVCQVPASLMSPAQKIVLLVIILHAQMWSQKAGEWWQVESETMAEQAGMAKETFLGHLSYLTKKLPLFEKRYEKEWYTPSDNERAPQICNTHIFIAPGQENRIDLPGAYHLAENVQERQHGGKQQPKPKCINCGSENIDEYTLHHCRDCDYKHWPLDAMVSHSASMVESEPPAPQEEVQDRQLAPYSEPTEDHHCTQDQEEDSKIGNLPLINKEDTTMIGKLPILEEKPIIPDKEQVTSLFELSAQSDKQPIDQQVIDILAKLKVGKVVHGPRGWAYVKRIDHSSVDLEHFGQVQAYNGAAILGITP